MSRTRLDPILADVRARAAERRRALPLAELEARVRPDPSRRERVLAALRKPELAFVCELKRRSPSAGRLERAASGASAVQPAGAAWTELAEAYRRGGADMLSVLTEADHFGGSLADLRAVEPARLPRLRKDFVLDEGMVLESALHGAEAVLLIAAILDDETLARLRRRAHELGLAVLLEVHDERELARALPLQPELLGVNARDLATLAIDLATVERLLPLVPRGPLAPLRVAESGIRGPDDLARVRAAGADAVLVGETLLRSADPESVLRAWKEGLRER